MFPLQEAILVQLLLSEHTDGWSMCKSGASWFSHSQSLYQCHCIKLTQESFGGGCAEDHQCPASVVSDARISEDNEDDLTL